MKKNIILSIILASAFIFSSCEDKLDSIQNGVSSVDDYYSTDDELESAMMSVYSLFSNISQGYFYLKNYPSDDMYAGGKQRGANAAIETLADIEITADNNYVRTIYQNLYQMIYRANCVLEYSKVDSKYARQAAAEARVIRAWAHMELAMFWGTPPLVDHILQPSEYLQPNSDKATLWNFIITELEGAISSGDLLEKTDANNVVYNITEGFAEALLGKAYLYNGDNNKAAQTLDNLISSNEYALYSGEYCNVIAGKVGEYNSEILFAVNAPEDPNNIQNNGSIFQAVGWRGEQFTWSQDRTIDVYTTGWGQANPTKDLYDAFVELEGENGYRLNNTLLTYDQIKSKGVVMKDGQTLDQHDGYFSYKFRYANSGRFNSGSSSAQDFVYMRFAEVILLAAEAHIYLNEGPKAAEYINMIRTRAKVDKNNDGNIDLVSGTESNLLDILKLEKRLELCYEGTRFQDLIRWGDAYEVLKDKSREIPSFNFSGVRNPKAFEYTSTGFKEGRNELLPYPTEEISVNTEIVQNPGY